MTWYESGEFGNTVKAKKDSFAFEASTYCFGWQWCTTTRGFNRHWPKIAGVVSGLEDRMFFVVSPEKPKPAGSYFDPPTKEAAKKTFEVIEAAILKGTYHFASFEEVQALVKGMNPRTMQMLFALALYFAIDLNREKIDAECLQRAKQLVDFRDQAILFLAPIEADNEQGRMQMEITRELRQHKGKMKYRDLCRELHADRFGSDRWKAGYKGLVGEGIIADYDEKTTSGQKTRMTALLVLNDFITAEAVNEWLVAPELEHLAPSTVRGVVTTLQLALGKRFGKGKISYPSNTEVEEDPRCYTAEEVQKVVEAASGQYSVLFKLAAETGARAGELYALTVGDVLFEHNVIRINKSMYRQKAGSPKTANATRWINVKPYVVEMLKGHLNGRSDGLVFRSTRGTPLINSTVLNKHLHPLLRKLGLERGGMHGFRHQRVSTLVMSGTPMAVIKKWIGHGSEEMVNRYTHLPPDFMRDELARVPDFAMQSRPKTVEIAHFDPQVAAVG